jgi:serine/threonine-protein kinase
MPAEPRFKPGKRRGSQVAPDAAQRHATSDSPPPVSTRDDTDFPRLSETEILRKFEERGQTLVSRRPQARATSGVLPEISGYRVLSELGKGSTGIVYRAVQLSMDRLVAVKVLYPECARRPEIASRFVSEVRAVGRLNHPNIIQGFDAGEAAGTFYFSMEYLDGHKVSDIISRGGAMDTTRATRIILDIARALEHAHKHGIIHRDIKPQNIVLSKTGGAKLCDLGLAFMAGSPDLGPGGAIGTPSYISPEQARGEREVDTRTDVYSLGASYYHMLTGVPPFVAASAAEVVRKHIVEMPIPARSRNPLVPEEANRIVLKMLAKRKEDRYQSPFALRMDLETLVQSLSAPPSAATPSARGKPTRSTGPAIRRHTRRRLL